MAPPSCVFDSRNVLFFSASSAEQVSGTMFSNNLAVLISNLIHLDDGHQSVSTNCRKKRTMQLVGKKAEWCTRRTLTFIGGWPTMAGEFFSFKGIDVQSRRLCNDSQIFSRTIFGRKLRGKIQSSTFWPALLMTQKTANDVIGILKCL